MSLGEVERRVSYTAEVQQARCSVKLTVPFLVSTCALLILPGCGDDDPPPPADVHGNYTLTVTNGPSSCPLPNWNQGAVTPNIPFTVTQNGSSVTADVGGAGAIFLNIYCGNTRLEGTVTGSDITLHLPGKNGFTSGSCTFTIDANVAATVQGDALTGSIVYAPNTNSSPDCAAVQSCSSRMNFNGVRPASGQ
jgi:hypothetical protein